MHWKRVEAERWRAPTKIARESRGPSIQSVVPEVATLPLLQTSLVPVLEIADETKRIMLTFDDFLVGLSRFGGMYSTVNEQPGRLDVKALALALWVNGVA